MSAALLEALRELPPHPDSGSRSLGICAYLEERIPDFYVLPGGARAIFCSLYVQWPLYSGDMVYPVPSAEEGQLPQAAYYLSGDMWAGDYGELRMQLVRWCIEQLEAQL